VSQPTTAQLRDLLTDEMPRIHADLVDLVRIPSVSQPGGVSPDVAQSAQAVADLLTGAGVADVRVCAARGGAPAVIARVPAPAGAPTVLLYAHHDVQPVGEVEDWVSDAFDPVERAGRLYGRGAADDKAGVMAHVGALRVLMAGFPDGLPVGVTVFVEGEEEIGSPTIGQFLVDNADLLAADVVLIADSSNAAVDVPGFTTSLRGVVEVFVEVRTHVGQQHSGVYGGLFPDALMGLVRVLSALHDDDGSVAVPGLVRGPIPAYDVDEESFRWQAGVLPDVARIGSGSAANRLWREPAVTVLGIDAPSAAQAGNMLLPTARAKVSMRIAPGQDPAAAQQALSQHLMASAPWGVRVTCEPGAVAQAVALEPSGPVAEVATAAFTEAWDGVGPAHMGIGGSIPFIADIAAQFPHATILVVGPGDPAASWHGPNESVDLGVLRRLTLAQVLLVARLGAITG
jgi:acetylornithine deacetylase/succinyl-diaminopimelate desuccinylase-like protein